MLIVQSVSVMASSSTSAPAGPSGLSASPLKGGGSGGGPPVPTGPCSSAMAANNSIGVILTGDANLIGSSNGAGAMSRLKEEEKKIQMVRIKIISRKKYASNGTTRLDFSNLNHVEKGCK